MKIALSVPISLHDVIEATAAKGQQEEKIFTHIATSSFEADENTLFFALDGKHTSGEEYVRALCAKGVFCISKSCGKNRLTHPSPRAALLSLAAYYKKHYLRIQKTVLITGSVGKTTTKEFLSTVLKCKWKTHANVGNLNSDIGMPLTILETPADTEILVLELGMNHRGEIRVLAECADGDLGIITSIGHAHIGNLGSLEEIALEKMDICCANPEMPVIIPNNETRLSSLKNKIRLGADILSPCETTEPNKHAFHLNAALRTDVIEIPILPEEITQCLLLAIGAAYTLGMTVDEIDDVLSKNTLCQYRRKEITVGGSKIIDDTYNASPESMRAGLRYLMQTKGKTHHAILGDMMELGEFTASLHEQLGCELAELSPDYIYLLGEHMHGTRRVLIEKGFAAERIFYFADHQDYERLVYVLSEHLREGDVCYFKASHSVKLWRVIEGLEEVYR